MAPKGPPGWGTTACHKWDTLCSAIQHSQHSISPAAGAENQGNPPEKYNLSTLPIFTSVTSLRAEPRVQTGHWPHYLMYFWKIPNWWGNHKNSTKNWAIQTSPEFLHPALCLSNASPQMQRTSNGLHLYSTLHSRVKFQPQPVAIQVRQAFLVKWQIHEISITTSTEISWEQVGILQKNHMHSVLHVNNSFTANFLHFKNVNINWKNPKHLDGSFCRRQFVR